MMSRVSSRIGAAALMALTFMLFICPSRAITQEPGTLKWRFETGFWVGSSPAIGQDGTVYVGSEDNYLYAINPDGSLKWKFRTGDYVDSSPAIGQDGTVYVGSWDNYLYAINPDGSLKWRFGTGGYVDSSPAIGQDGTVYVGSWDNYLYAINPDGSLKWVFRTGGDVCSSPAIGQDGTVYVGSADNYLYAINPDGSLKWRFRTGGGVPSSPAIGQDGTVYVGSDDHYLYAINPDGSLKWKFGTGGYVCSSPAIGQDGTVYVGSADGYLYAIYTDSEGLADSPWPMFGHDVMHTRRAGISAPQPNVLAVLDTSAGPGGVGEVPICLDNEVDVAGVEFVLNYDPDVLSLDSVKATARTQQMDIFSWNTTKPGKARLLIADTGGDLIGPDSCSIADFFFTVDPEASPGDTTCLSLSDVVLLDVFGREIMVRTLDGIFVIVIGGVKGDLNGDGMVDVRDIVILINIILDKVTPTPPQKWDKVTPTPPQKWAGDLNGDGSLDVRDVVLLVNKILGRTSQKVAKASSLPVVLKMAEAGGSVSISMDAAVPIAGVQLELVYDPKVYPGEPELRGRGLGMTLASNIGDGRLKILAYSLEGRTIKPGAGPVISIPFDVEDIGQVILEEVILSDADGRSIPADVEDRSLEFRVQKALQLWQNSPNPFNSRTSIRYYLPEAGKVALEVWDILGRRVRRLVDGYRPAGYHTVRWDGKDELGKEVSSGIYLYCIRFGDHTEMRKMLLVR